MLTSENPHCTGTQFQTHGHALNHSTITMSARPPLLHIIIHVSCAINQWSYHQQKFKAVLKMVFDHVMHVVFVGFKSSVYRGAFCRTFPELPEIHAFILCISLASVSIWDPVEGGRCLGGEYRYAHHSLSFKMWGHITSKI